MAARGDDEALGDAGRAWTVGRLGALAGLSRSTLLYYDSIGLLSPSGRSASGYRLYTESDRRRLEKIVAFRSIGLQLELIRGLLDLEGASPAGALLKRVFEINEGIGRLREQQRAILALLEADGSLKVGKAALIALADLGKAAGVSEANYEALHAAFEENSPAEHRRLLGLLGFTELEIAEFLAQLDARP
jgi:MerR family transcriptional regulator, thiopeptide resistance regulator